MSRGLIARAHLLRTRADRLAPLRHAPRAPPRWKPIRSRLPGPRSRGQAQGVHRIGGRRREDIPDAHRGARSRRRGVDVVVGFIEAHGRAETAAQMRDLEVVPRQRSPIAASRSRRWTSTPSSRGSPQVALVDELAHTQRARRRSTASAGRTCCELLDDGINVITAVNVQHLESLNDVVAARRSASRCARRCPTGWSRAADQVVNIDISAEDLRQRLREGKIYGRDKIPTPRSSNFFTEENLTTLRELALREVASSVDRTREDIVRREDGWRRRALHDRRTASLVAMASNPPQTARAAAQGEPHRRPAQLGLVLRVRPDARRARRSDRQHGAAAGSWTTSSSRSRWARRS